MRIGLLSLLCALTLLAGCQRTSSSSHIIVLRINEVMADNSEYVAGEPNGLALDWIEIFNPTGTAVRLEGYTLTDNPDRTNRYRFPPHLVVPAGGFLVIWLIGDGERDRINVDRAAQGLGDVVLTDRHADFGISAGADTLFLFADGRQIDRIGLAGLPLNASVVRFPDGGFDIGRNFAPTPGAPNFAFEAFAPQFASSDQPRIELCAAPTAHASFEFSVVIQEPKEGERLDVPDVSLRILDGFECRPGDQSLERCLELFAEPPPGAQVRDLQIMPDADQEKTCETSFVSDPETGESRVGRPTDATCPSETTDGSYNDVRFRVLKYQGELPRGDDPLIQQSDDNFPARLIWLEVENSLGHLDSCICHVFGSGCFDIVISEYQPVNPDEEFVCENCEENRGVQTPDWVEIYNFGETEVDIREFGLVGRNAARDNPRAWLFGRDTGDDPGYSTLGPGKRLLILADTDAGDLLVERKIFRRVTGRDEFGAPILDTSCRYYSAKFGLDPRRARERDRFALTAPASPVEPPPGVIPIQVVIDEAVLDFDQFFRDNPPADPENDFNGPIRGLSVIRDLARLHSGDPTPRECVLPGVDAEWCISLCPSPARCPGSETGANRLDCGQSVELLDELSIRAAGAPAGVARRCPALGEGVVVTAFATVNNETVNRLEGGEDPSLSVELEVEDSLGERFVLSLGAGIVAIRDEERQAEARLGTTLLRLEATIPPQVEGVVTILRLTIRDEFLASQGDADEGVELSDELSGAGAENWSLSFSYFSGDPPLDASPILSEIFPHNDVQDASSRYVLPGFEGGLRSNYMELHLPADASVESFDLGGFYLTTTPSAGAPITHARQYRLPDNIPPLERGGFLLLVDVALPSEGDDPPPFPVASIRGFPLAPAAGAVYLVGPDRLGNCVVGGISWNRSDVAHPEGWGDCPSTFPKRQYCYGVGCADILGAVQVSPTPGASNVLQPILVSAFHHTRARPNVCNFVDDFNSLSLRAVVFLDREMALRLGGSEMNLEVPESLPLATFELSVGDAIGVTSANTEDLGLEPPEGYVTVWITQSVIVPPDAGLVSYSVLLEDECGGVLEPPTGEGSWTFRVDGGAPPQIFVNEVNRGYPLPGGGGDGRPWIELYNPSSVAVDLGGFSISSVAEDPRMHLLDAGTIVPARGTLLLVTDGGDPLVGEEPPAHVVIDFPWISIKEKWFRSGSECQFIRTNCGTAPQSDDSAPPVTLFLIDQVASGSCLVDSFEGQFPDRDCHSPRGLGRVPDGGDIVVIDEPTPGEVAGAPEVTFVRGDADGDGLATLTDAVAVLDFLFRAADGPACVDILDVDDSGRLNVSDAVYALAFLFRGGDAPPPPFPDAGVDPTPDEIPCDAS